MMATAGKITVAEVEEIVEIGHFDPDFIHTPGIYVQRVVKNTLLRKAFEQVKDRDYSEFYDLLKGPTALMICDAANAPAKVIKDFRKKNGKKPILKGAWVQDSIYIGPHLVDDLINIKSKEQLIGELIGLLQSPAKNVISALQSGGNTIAGLVKTLQERES